VFSTASFNDVFLVLEQYGALDSLLPFLLIFTVIFAFLQKGKFLGDGKKNFNVMVAFIISAMTIIPHLIGTYPLGADPILIINNAIPNVSVWIIFLVMLWIVIGMLGGGIGIGSTMGSVLALISFIVIVVIFGQSAGWWNGGVLPAGLGGLLTPETVGIIVVVAAFVIVVMFITGEGSGPSFGNLKVAEGVRDLFKDPGYGH
jgi:hypothetical protein